MNVNFTGFVLAGGRSSRMGRDKFALPINGETFLARAASVLNTVCAEVKIVLNDTQSLETDLPVVRDIYAMRGALGGIHAALVNCETEFAVLLAVDLPLVTPVALEKLIEISSIEKYAAVVPHQSDGKLQPLCAVYRVSASLPAAEKMLAGGQSAAMRDFLKTIDTRFVPQAVLSPDENLFFNVNQPFDLTRLEEMSEKE